MSQFEPRSEYPEYNSYTEDRILEYYQDRKAGEDYVFICPRCKKLSKVGHNILHNDQNPSEGDLHFPDVFCASCRCTLKAKFRQDPEFFNQEYFPILGKWASELEEPKMLDPKDYAF